MAGAARHDQTCPGEMSKTFRLASQAREEIERAGLHCDFLDLSLLTAEYGRADSALQSLRLDRDAALPLAVLLLPESCDGSSRRLDERIVSKAGSPPTA